METSSNGEGKDVMVGNRRAVRFSDLGLRFVALVLTLAAAVLVGLDKQTKLVPVTVVSTLPPLNVHVTAKWQYMSAFTYFVVANAIACAYGALSLILILANRGQKKRLLTMAIIILDLAMVALLASGNGAATAIGVIGYQGNSHVNWNKVCDSFGRFCHQLLVGVVVSLLGSLSFSFLVMLAALDLHKKHY